MLIFFLTLFNLFKCCLTWLCIYTISNNVYWKHDLQVMMDIYESLKPPNP